MSDELEVVRYVDVPPNCPGDYLYFQTYENLSKKREEYKRYKISFKLPANSRIDGEVTDVHAEEIEGGENV